MEAALIHRLPAVGKEGLLVFEFATHLKEVDNRFLKTFLSIFIGILVKTI